MVRFRSEDLGGDVGDVDHQFRLINGRPPEDRATITVRPGSKVRLRLINAGSDTAYRFAIGGHRLTVTHTDGYPVQPVEVGTLIIGMGERYDIAVTRASGVWPIVALAEGKGKAAEALLRTSDSTASAAPPVGTQPVELTKKLLMLANLKATEASSFGTLNPDVTAA
jgi:FtsP/CotA-like multicopper oxidase with cupredoxin domain